MSLLTLSQVSLKIDQHDVLSDINVEIAKGRLIGLIGPNGAGKSTLLKTILGLTPKFHGKISLGTDELSTIAPEQRARKIAYLAQGQVAHWPLSVERIVALGRFPHMAHWQTPSDEDQDIINKCMRDTDILHLQERSISTLSGGERLRVLLARALAVKADILLADEPIAALDPAQALSIMQLLRDNANAGNTTIAVLHDLTLASRFCHELILMDQGKVIATGAAKTVLSKENLAAVYHIKAYDKQSADDIILPWSLC